MGWRRHNPKIDAGCLTVHDDALTRDGSCGAASEDSEQGLLEDAARKDPIALADEREPPGRCLIREHLPKALKIGITDDGRWKHERRGGAGLAESFNGIVKKEGGAIGVAVQGTGVPFPLHWREPSAPERWVGEHERSLPAVCEPITASGNCGQSGALPVRQFRPAGKQNRGDSHVAEDHRRRIEVAA